MSEGAVRNSHASRMRLLVFPREHGAWGMLFVPLVTGAWLGLWQGGKAGPLLLLIIAASALFCLRTPVEGLLGNSAMRAQTAEEKRTAALVTAIFGAISTAALLILLAGGEHRRLLMIGAAAGAMFVTQALVKKLGRKARMPAQLIGALGLTSTAPAAYYVVTGILGSRAVALWLANWAFASEQIHFVQMRIRGARLQSWEEKVAHGRLFLAGQILMMLALVAASHIGLWPGMVILAFVPVFVRGLLWFVSTPKPLDVHRLGFTELAHAIVFGVLLVITFHSAV